MNHAVGVGITVRHKDGVGDDDAFGAESRIGVGERDEAAHHQGATDKQHTGKRDLGKDEDAPSALGAGAAAGAGGAFERVLQIGARRGEGGADAK